MTYSYLELSPTVIRPIIKIIIKSGKNFAIYPMLIDSGADYCILSIDVAKALGIQLSKKKVSFQGVSRDKIVGLWGEVDVRIDNIDYRLQAIFAEISGFGHGILGQKGFFDHFDVNLRYQADTIELTPVNLKN